MCEQNKLIIFFLAFLTGYSIVCAQYTYAPTNATSEPVSGTTILMADDAVSSTLPIGFSFCFWGIRYTQCYIGSNGWVGFTAGQPIAFTPFTIPTTNFLIPKNCIMGPFHDMRPDWPVQNPYVSYYTAGVAPNRRLVVSWTAVPMYVCTASKSTQQIVLFESGLIRVNIITKHTCMGWVSGLAILGLHSPGGASAVTVAARNATTWNITAPESWEFMPLLCCPQTVSSTVTQP